MRATVTIRQDDGEVLRLEGTDIVAIVADRDEGVCRPYADRHIPLKGVAAMLASLLTMYMGRFGEKAVHDALAEAENEAKKREVATGQTWEGRR